MRLRDVIEVVGLKLRTEGFSGVIFAIIAALCPSLFSKLCIKKNEIISQLLAVEKQLKDNTDLLLSAKKKICILAYEEIHIDVLKNIIRINDYSVNGVEVVSIKHTQENLASYFGDDLQKIGRVVIPTIKNNSSSNNLIENTVLLTAVSELVCIWDRWDMIIIPTVEANIEAYKPVVYKLSEKKEVVVMLHNLNRCFGEQKANPGLRDLITKASAYAVPDALLVEEASRHNLTGKHIYEYCCVFQETPVHIKKVGNEKVVFTITGEVINHSKDYALVMNAFFELHDYYDKVELILLGSAASSYGKRIVRSCKEMQLRGLSVHFFDDFVPTDIFQQTMNRTDFLLGPVQEHYDFYGVYETYNKTKLSGLVLDMIGYAKPGIVPGYLRMPDKLASSTVYYNKPDDLKDVIISLLDKKVAREYAENALQNSRKYSLG